MTGKSGNNRNIFVYLNNHRLSNIIFNMKAVFTAIMLSSMVGGIYLAPYFNVSSIGLFALFAIFFILSISVIPEKWLWVSMVAIGFFFLGILRYQQYDASFQERGYAEGESIEIVGKIDMPPEETKKATKVVVYDADHRASLLLITGQFPKYKYGELLKVEGRVVIPKEESYKNNLISKGISGQILFPKIERAGKAEDIRTKALGALYGLRGIFEESINKVFPEPESSFLSGILLGVKRSLPEWLTEDLKKSGTSHLIALSGFNITVIVMGLRLVFSRKSAQFSFYAPLAAIFAFVIMTGSQSSVVRAGIMGAMMLLAYKVGRQSSAAMAIVLTAAAMILANPYILKFDIGFQLSFAAFMGIIYIAPIIKNALPGRFEIVKEIAAMTIAAQVMAYPLVLYYFGNFSTVALFTNLIVLPFIPIAMLLGFLSTVFAMIWPVFGYLVSWTAYFILHIMVSIIHFAANLSFSSFDGLDLSASGVVFVYVTVFLLVFIYKMIKRRQFAGSEKS